jgi:hypothetical protein
MKDIPLCGSLFSVQIFDCKNLRRIIMEITKSVGLVILFVIMTVLFKFVFAGAHETISGASLWLISVCFGLLFTVVFFKSGTMHKRDHSGH